MIFNIITLFPNLFTEHLNTLPFKRGLGKGIIKVNLINLRDYSVDKHGTVDNKPYGGGVGMILMVEPIYKALNQLPKTDSVILLSPRGKRYTQERAENLAKTKGSITLICGRYEGVDARVENYCTDIVSVGDYILSGGEIPALVIMESVVRLLDGIIENKEAIKDESFANGSIEYPQYTRPEEFKGMKVPNTLLSGDHKKINEWREKNSTIL